ncbi:MAG: SGNH/GDSL hydrolase family protein [Candidatus Omnitrophica bacterium]|nr:SGNH/GDSL hydrolase family protein [Candidatus Omnitrophota bacterium]
MKLLPKENKLSLIAIYSILFFLAVGSLFYGFFGHRLIEAMYKGESIEFLNKIIVGQARRPLEHYLRTANRLFFYFFSLSALLIVFIMLFTFVVNYLKARRNKFLADISLVCLTLLFLFLTLEVIVRTYYFFQGEHKFYMLVESFYDSKLGWKGKQIFGDPESEKYKIFFIGDSFTHGCVLSEEHMYYTVLADSLDAEIFAYGAGGYGTLQEYLILDKFFDEIKPDLVMLQVCDNDFVNNSWELESRSFYNNHLMMRPYLREGKIEYRFPRSLGNIRVFLCLHSNLFYLSFNRIDRILAILAKKGLLHSVEEDISKKELDFVPFKRAVFTTNSIIAKMKQRVGNTPIVAFSVDNRQPYFKHFRRIFKKNNIEFIEAVPKLIGESEEKGLGLRLEEPSPFAGHFNGLGNRICAETLIKAMGDLGLIRK